MDSELTAVMRASLWLLMAAASALALFWLVLVAASDFSIWTTDSNAAGLTLQAALLLSPIGLLVALKQSRGSLWRTLLLFGLAWSAVIGAAVLVIPS